MDRYKKRLENSGLPWEGYYYSAYGLAVKRGFKGTEEEWLASLRGSDGKSAYESAQDGGYTGTEEQFNRDLSEVSQKEASGNKVTSLSEDSTDTQYPSAKCVYDIVGNIETALEALL